MAFDYTNLYPDTSANGGFTKSWNYTTLDPLATVSASGYFNKVSTRIGIGDNIIVAVVDAYDKTRTTLVEYGTLYVNGISGGVVTTTSSASSAYILPNPTSTTLGGVKSAAPVTSQWVNSISASGVPALSQPGFSDIAGSVAAGQQPAHTGDVTSPSGSVVNTIAVNAVTNAKAAQMAAYTLKGNATAALANQSDIDITSLTLKASPVSGDIILIQDSAASFAFKKATVGSTATAGSVSSIAGNTGAFTLGTGLTNATNDLRVSLTGGTNINVTGATIGVTGVIAGANGGTNNGFMQFTGPATSTKTFTLPNSTDVIAVLGVAQNFNAVQRFSAAGPGTILVNAAGPISVEILTLAFDGTTKVGTYINETSGTTTAAYAQFGRVGTVVGSIAQNGAAAVSYNISSDSRLKDDLRPVLNVRDKIAALAVYDFQWNGTFERGIGFMAQEAHSVIPEAVRIGGDDPKTDPWQVDYSKAVPTLWANAQDANARIERLELQIQKLETLLKG